MIYIFLWFCHWFNVKYHHLSCLLIKLLSLSMKSSSSCFLRLISSNNSWIMFNARLYLSLLIFSVNVSKKNFLKNMKYMIEYFVNIFWNRKFLLTYVTTFADSKSIVNEFSATWKSIWTKLSTFSTRICVSRIVFFAILNFFRKWSKMLLFFNLMIIIWTFVFRSKSSRRMNSNEWLKNCRLSMRNLTYRLL